MSSHLLGRAEGMSRGDLKAISVSSCPYSAANHSHSKPPFTESKDRTSAEQAITV